MEIAKANEFLQEAQDGWIPDLLKRAGLKPVPNVQVALSFPTNGGEAVEPPVTKDGAPNPKAGLAKTRFQYIPTVALTDGKMDEAIKANPILSMLTRNKRVSGHVPVICITPALHTPHAGNVFGIAGDAIAEMANRLHTLAFANVFASILNDPPDGAELTKGGKVKVFNGHFERYAARLGFLGDGKNISGWSVNAALKAEILDLAKTAPDGAAINLEPPDSNKIPSTTSVTLRAEDGTEFTISARILQSKKQKEAGKKSALQLLRTGGTFYYVSDKAKEDGTGETEPDAPEA